MSVKFTIITVSFNSEKTIENTIQSVLNQSYKDFEYIIVDGESKDGTLDIIKRYSKLDSRIKYVSEEDFGIYDAMNKGIRMASGDVIALLNSDDYYEPNALKTIADVVPIEERFVIYGMVRFIKDELENMVTLCSHNAIPERMMMHPGCFVSRSIYQEYLYDTSYKSAADYDLFIRLYQDKRIHFYPVYSIIANFRLGGMSSSITSKIETNDIKYKYGYISKRTHDVSNMYFRIKSKVVK